MVSSGADLSSKFIKECDAVAAEAKNVIHELEFLRHFYSYIKDIMSESGTDEVYWASEDYIEKTGKQLPKGYE